MRPCQARHLLGRASCCRIQFLNTQVFQNVVRGIGAPEAPEALYIAKEKLNFHRINPSTLLLQLAPIDPCSIRIRG